MPNSKLAALLSLCAAAFAQSPAGSTASLQGFVTNSVTGEPLQRVHVSLRPVRSGPPAGLGQLKRYGALTTVEGKFSVTGMDPGRYSVTLEKTGFGPSFDNPMLFLKPGDANDTLKLQMVPAGSVTGRVLYPGGVPAEGIQVQVEIASNPGMFSAWTDDRGQYRIGGLEPGKYRVRALPVNLLVPPETRTDGTSEVQYAATYYPGVLLPKDAARVEVHAGADTGGVDIPLLRTSVVRVSGTVSGLPPSTRNVHIELRRGRATTTTGIVSENGSFVLWRPNPGPYTIQAVWTSPAGLRMQSTPVDIEVADRNIDRVTLNVIPPIELAGHVEYEDERARPPDPSPATSSQPGGPSQQVRRAAPPRIQFSALDGTASQGTELAAGDTFHIAGLLPQKYLVSVFWGPVYVRSMRLGSAAVEGAVLDLRGGSPGNGLTLVVSSATASMKGVVTTGSSPSSGAVVILMSADPAGGAPTLSAAVRPDGSYVIAGVAPGKYLAGAIAEAQRNALMRIGALPDLADSMETVELHPGEQLAKDLKLIKP